MIKFNVGDRVRRINQDNFIVDPSGERRGIALAGSCYTVSQLAGEWIFLEGQRMDDGPSDPRYFELVRIAPTVRSNDPSTSKGEEARQ